MAVSMTQYSNKASKRQTMAYYSATIAAMPIPEHFHHSHGQHYSQPPAYYQQKYASQRTLHYQRSFTRPAYDYKPLSPPRPPFQQEQLPGLPPRPPKTPVETTVQHNSTAWPRSPTTSTASTIAPDPLPPHSNPQALTQTQSIAFEDSAPIAPVHIGKEDVYDLQTGFALFVITREAAHMPSFLSSKPLVTVRRIDGTTMGTIRFHSVTTSSIDISVNGRNTRMSHSGLLHSRWVFQSTSCPNAEARWYWTSDKTSKGAKLVDSKKNGQVVARMKGDLLTFEKGRLSSESYDEVLLSAVAMAEAARRAKRNGDLVDLGSPNGDLTSSGSDGGGGDGGGGSAC